MMYLFKKTLAIFSAALVMLSAFSTMVSATQPELSDAYVVENQDGTEETTEADYSRITIIEYHFQRMKLENYTDESVARVQAVLDSIVYGLDSSQQAVVDAYAEELSKAYMALEIKKADMSYLEDVLSEIPEDLSIYTEETIANLNAEIEKAEAEIVETDITDSMAIAVIKTRIRSKIEELEFNSLDYEPVLVAKSKIPSDLSLYIEETVQALNNALENPPEHRTRSEMDNWAAEIEAAIKGLMFKDADFTAMDNALAKIPTDLSPYTRESVAALNLVLAKPGGFTIDKQAEIDAAAQEIEAAVANLKIKETNVTSVKTTKVQCAVVVEYIAEKIQLIGNGTTRTYTRDSDAVTIKSYDVNGKERSERLPVVYEVWTIEVELPDAEYTAVARYKKVWDTLGYEFEVKTAGDDTFISADVAVNGLEVTYTVVTGLDTSKIQITDNGSTKTLASGYTDTDVRTWTYTKIVAKGDHAVTFAYKTNVWNETEVACEYEAKIETAKTDTYSGTVDSSVLRGEKVGFTVTTSTDASKIQFVFEDGSTITLASGYEDFNGTRTWAYSKEFADGDYSVKVMAKHGREWVDTKVVLDFEVI